MAHTPPPPTTTTPTPLDLAKQQVVKNYLSCFQTTRTRPIPLERTERKQHEAEDGMKKKQIFVSESAFEKQKLQSDMYLSFMTKKKE